MTTLSPDSAPAVPDATPADSSKQKQPRRLFRSTQERAADKARARALAARAAIEEQRARDQIALERLEAERELAKVREELADRAKQRQDEAAAERRTFRQRISRAVVLATANVGVNAVAVLGQVLALTLGLGWDWWAAVPLALVVESVAVNVGYIAHDKLINGYSAGWLRFLSYGIGAAVGWFNYEHNSATITAANGVEVAVPTADYAVVFGAASLLSPVLWQIYSQWKHWQQLRDADLLDARAPKFSRARWILWLGETFYITRRAVRHGISDRAEAVRRFQPVYEQKKRKGRKAAKPLPPAADELQQLLARWAEEFRQRGPEAVAFGDHSATASATGRSAEPASTEATAAVLSINGDGDSFLKALARRLRPVAIEERDRSDDLELVADVDAETVAHDDTEDEVVATGPRPVADRERPNEQDRKRAIRFYINRAKKLNPPSKRTLAEWTGFSETWALGCIQEGRQILTEQGWTFDDRGTPTPPEPVADAVATTPIPNASSGEQ